MTTTLETARSISTFMTDLYGLKVSATENAERKLEKTGAIASYVDDSGEVHGHIYCDFVATAILGAALTQIPKGAVEDAISSGTLPDNLKENIAEVFNISVNLFPSHTTLRLVLKEVLFEAEAEAVAKELTPSVSLDLDVNRYGTGGMFLSH